LISAAAAVGIVFQTIHLILQFVGTDSNQTGAILNTKQRTASATVDPDSIARAHLFGTANSPITSNEPPVSRINLVLAGTIATDDPGVGYAIVGENAANAKFYSVGTSIGGAGRLHSVYMDRIVLDRGGTLETIVMPRGTSSAYLMPARTSVSADASAPSTSRGDSNLGNMVRLQKASVGHGQTGYRLFPTQGMKGMRDFVAAGLEPGDVVVTINGSPVAGGNSNADLFKSMGSSSSALLGIVRDGKPMNVSVQAH
jgi:general secretion pathway protein C